MNEPIRIVCRRCDQIGPHRARGLCKACYERLKRTRDELRRFESSRWPEIGTMKKTVHDPITGGTIRKGARVRFTYPETL